MPRSSSCKARSTGWHGCATGLDTVWNSHAPAAKKARPLSRWERVGGYNPSLGRDPPPGLLRNPTSPTGRGEAELVARLPQLVPVSNMVCTTAPRLLRPCKTTVSQIELLR